MFTTTSDGLTVRRARVRARHFHGPHFQFIELRERILKKIVLSWSIMFNGMEMQKAKKRTFNFNYPWTPKNSTGHYGIEGKGDEKGSWKRLA